MTLAFQWNSRSCSIVSSAVYYSKYPQGLIMFHYGKIKFKIIVRLLDKWHQSSEAENTDNTEQSKHYQRWNWQSQNQKGICKCYLAVLSILEKDAGDSKMEFAPKVHQQFSCPLTPYRTEGPIDHSWSYLRNRPMEKKVVLCVIFKVKFSVGPKKGQNCS